MNHSKRNLYIEIAVVVVSIYAMLIVLLAVAEQEDPASDIQSFGDALWYSLVTLTTVGYGDMVPSTTMGHVIGVIFIVLSVGILAALIGTFISFMSSKGGPYLTLYTSRTDNWYYFASLGLEADALARQLASLDPKGVIIFGLSREQADLEPDYPCIFLDVSPERISHIKGKGNGRVRVFLMEENDIGANPRALGIAELPVDVYARTASGENSLAGNIHFFNGYECCAREYWHDKPLSEKEQKIALIGFGLYGQALLEQAIMVNVLSPDQHVSYHIFGDHGKFLQIHTHLGAAFSLQKESETEDSLLFHDDPWYEEPEVLKDADRIIICEDDEFEGWDILWTLRKFYITKDRVDLRSTRRVTGVSYFGDNHSVYSPAHVLNTSMDLTAVAMNDLYYSKHPEEEQKDWDHLDDYLKQSMIAASDHLLIKVRILLQDESIKDLTPENMEEAEKIYKKNIQDPAMLDWYRRLSHLRWVRFYSYYNWTCGEKVDHLARKDPRICPYEEMSPEDRGHGDYYWELLGQLPLSIQKIQKAH